MHVPSNIFIAGKAIHAWYPSQPKICQQCGSEDQVAANCCTEKCFNCEAPGHRAEDCTKPTLCGICMESHTTAMCPYLRFSANIEENPGDSSYAEVAKRKPVHPSRRAEKWHTYLTRAKPVGKCLVTSCALFLSTIL